MTSYHDQSGLTFLELLTVLATISILAALSIVNFVSYKEYARESVATDQLHKAQVALEAGQTEASALGIDEFFWAWSQPDGSFMGWRVEDFLPGIVLSPDSRLYVTYDSWCDSAIWHNLCPGTPCCLRYYIESYHCDGETVQAWSQWNDGTTVSFEFENLWGC